MQESQRSSGEARARVEVDLLARLAAGEREEPLVELYRVYGRRLYGLGLRLLGDASAAEELVQETFVRIWRSAGSYDPTVAPPRAWILVLARRTAIDLQRRAAARPRAAQHTFDAEGERPDPPAGIPGDSEIDRLVAALDVRHALSELSPRHREVLELGYREQLTQSEIAEHLGIPLGTVKTRTYHALRELRTLLEQEQVL